MAASELALPSMCTVAGRVEVLYVDAEQPSLRDSDTLVRAVKATEW